MSVQTLAMMITFYANQFGIDPNLAISVAEVESSMNVKAVGAVGEIGLFQIRPEYSRLSREELKDPLNNIVIGTLKLREAKNKCKHQKDNTWVICYNRGIAGGSKVEDPYKNEYFLKVKNRINSRNIANK